MTTGLGARPSDSSVSTHRRSLRAQPPAYAKQVSGPFTTPARATHATACVFAVPAICFSFFPLHSFSFHRQKRQKEAPGEWESGGWRQLPKKKPRRLNSFSQSTVIRLVRLTVSPPGWLVPPRRSVCGVACLATAGELVTGEERHPEWNNRRVMVAETGVSSRRDLPGTRLSFLRRSFIPSLPYISSSMLRYRRSVAAYMMKRTRHSPFRRSRRSRRGCCGRLGRRATPAGRLGVSASKVFPSLLSEAPQLPLLHFGWFLGR